MMLGWLQRHLQIFLQTLGRMCRQPVPTLMTLTVIAIALALPATLLLIAQSLDQLTDSWTDTAQLSVFLDYDVDESTAMQLLTEIQSREDVNRVEYLSPDAALTEFREMSGLGEAVENLPENPLPSTLLVEPTVGMLETGDLDALALSLAEIERVNQVIVDSAWLERLRRLLDLARVAGLALAVMLGLGVVLIISNTVRLSVLNRREEIEIIDLVGGTPSFIRRPFLYMGLLQGVVGGILAWMIVRLTLGLLASRVDALSALYGGTFSLPVLGWQSFVGIVLIAGLLGWMASRLTVSWQLRRQLPSKKL